MKRISNNVIKKLTSLMLVLALVFGLCPFAEKNAIAEESTEGPIEGPIAPIEENLFLEYRDNGDDTYTVAIRVSGANMSAFEYRIYYNNANVVTADFSTEIKELSEYNNIPLDVVAEKYYVFSNSIKETTYINSLCLGEIVVEKADFVQKFTLVNGISGKELHEIEIPAWCTPEPTETPEPTIEPTKAPYPVCGDYMYEVVDNAAIIKKYIGSATDVVIPDTLDNYPVLKIGHSAFSWNNNIISVKIPSSVIGIDDESFYWCTSLKSVDIPDSVTYIGEWAFKYCSNLSEVVMPDSIIEINNQAFYDCSALIRVSLSDNLKTIGESAFYGCKNLNNIVIPEEVEIIDQNAFGRCEKLTNIHIPGSVNYIGNGAFSGCSSLTEIFVFEDNENYSSVNGVLYDKEKSELIQYPIGKENTDFISPDTVSHISSGAFSYASNLTNIFLQDNLEVIGTGAFYGCTSLKEIDIPKSVKQIDSQAFARSGLEKIDIPMNVKTLGEGIFSYCENLKDIKILASISIIEEGMFKGCSSLLNVQIPDSVINIAYEAFSECTNLCRIKIPNNVESISGYAFFDCKSLSVIDMSDNIIDIANEAFSGTQYYNNEENWIDGVLYIDNSLIAAKSDIVGKYSILEGTNCIADWAFRNCGKLTDIILPDCVQSIGEQSFYDCTSLESIILSSELSYIGDDAFYRCASLDNIVLPDGIDYIGGNVFYGTEYYNNNNNWTDNILINNTYLIKANNVSGEFNVPDNITCIAAEAFSNCKEMNKIVLNSKISKIEKGTFQYCSNLGDIIIPNNIVAIDSYAFYSCSSLKKVTIPDSVTYIGSGSFAQCAELESIIIPRSVIEIGKNIDGISVFSNCGKLAIYGYPESYIEQYAVEKGIPFVIIKEDEPIVTETPNHSESPVYTETPNPTNSPLVFELGHVDDNGKIDAGDALWVLKSAARISELTEAQKLAADVTKDGKVDATDALMILKYAAKIIESF